MALYYVTSWAHLVIVSLFKNSLCSSFSADHTRLEQKAWVKAEDPVVL